MAFFSRLWIQGKGYPGKYLEQGGHQRRHEDPWLYSICLPIEAELLTPEQAAEALYYTEWGLQNIRTPFGGRRVWASNWVPAVRSVRVGGFRFSSAELLPVGACRRRMGLSERPAIRRFLRATRLSQSGCQPLLPPGGRGVVRLRARLPQRQRPDCTAVPRGLEPCFCPHARDGGAVQTQGDTEMLDVELTRPATLDLRLPVRAKHLVSVTVDGKPVPWDVLPGFGQSVVKVSLPACKAAVMTVTVRDRLPQFGPVQVQGCVGQEVTLRVEGDATRVSGTRRPPGPLASAALKDNEVVGNWPPIPASIRSLPQFKWATFPNAASSGWRSPIRRPNPP